uniref:S-locus F-box protein type-14 n=1 Tax=Solanum chilense TaxID=4083 RepID=A0A075TS85_SOLCI|nr:S-locus F-box protein type-14 [Solanum chilense]
MAHGVINKSSKDLIIFIHLKFPVKSIKRFNCISKFFFKVIKSSTFVNLYLNSTTTTQEEFIMHKRSNEE